MGLMTRPGLVHAHTLAPPDLFWRTFGVVALFVGVLLGVAFAVGPLVLLAVYRNLWLLLLLPLVAGGAWMAIKISRHWGHLRWHYAHLPRATLFDDRIEAVEWRTPFMKGVKLGANETSRERTIPLDAVTSVVASFAIVRRTTTPRRAIPVIETAPVLYIRYDDDGGQDLLSVPFSSHKDEGVDRWLSYFAGAGIPLHYTRRILFRHDTQVLTDADRLKHLNAAADIISLHLLRRLACGRTGASHPVDCARQSDPPRGRSQGSRAEGQTSPALGSDLDLDGSHFRVADDYSVLPAAGCGVGVP